MPDQEHDEKCDVDLHRQQYLGDLISSITISTLNNSFSETNNCPASLGAGQSCTITVTRMESDSVGALSVFDNGGASPQSVALSGRKFCTPSMSTNSASLASEAAACGGQ